MVLAGASADRHARRVDDLMMAFSIWIGFFDQWLVVYTLQVRSSLEFLSSALLSGLCMSPDANHWLVGFWSLGCFWALLSSIGFFSQGDARH
jgi:hypothetical protein